MGLVQVRPLAESWQILIDGQQQGIVYDTKDEAAWAGRQLAKDHGAEFQLHAHDGSIREWGS
jgi:hypothetical protein